MPPSQIPDPPIPVPPTPTPPIPDPPTDVPPIPVPPMPDPPTPTSPPVPLPPTFPPMQMSPPDPTRPPSPAPPAAASRGLAEPPPPHPTRAITTAQVSATRKPQVPAMTPQMPTRTRLIRLPRDPPVPTNMTLTSETTFCPGSEESRDPRVKSPLTASSRMVAGRAASSPSVSRSATPHVVAGTRDNAVAARRQRNATTYTAGRRTRSCVSVVDRPHCSARTYSTPATQRNAPVRCCRNAGSA
jgi:hypothetical protein